MSTDDHTRDVTAANRVSWDKIAARRPPRDAAFFADGGSTLESYEHDRWPDVAGDTLLHLACATGNESLSWAVRGARVTGVDISAVGLELARTTAAAAGLEVDFVAADLYALPVGLGPFDRVFASTGVICWLPDLDRWARIVADHLVPGGRFLLVEHHPLWEVLGVRGSTTLAPTISYFGRGTPTAGAYDRAKTPSGSTADDGFTAFVWPVSDVVSSLLRAGLEIVCFEERPEPEMYAGLDPAVAALIPAVYVIEAVRTT